ncbi:hypothetical protein BAUCODRAFT_144233 [Baudoinia panamericana UAMH 10762]|uniref:Molybdate-anion transporter n=1 Tax=Baudoinia panamericana (strain UAMH 10762) TaxID=717646 RepID=M2MUI4_BAUPA|nr:uncharacterized protein BAUCODRAFT_144233 [Baudoinia panamericana UAMH 10762]EMD00582.1 hypothetical protein BAUCODRAFT_144233 [Baudoinia panamericana UAMH 10762]
MELYTLYFGAMLSLNGVALYYRYQRARQESVQESIALPETTYKDAASHFRTTYFGVYILATAADWLQGPYLYTLYKDSMGLPESTVAALFTTGFLAAAISASFVGTLADTYGRRSACIGYCVFYSLSCLTVLSEDVLILFVGRVLGGMSTTLLFSVFETWMIAEYKRQELSASGLKLGDMFSMSVILSGVVAIACGIISEVLVEETETKTAPFVAAICCLVTAAVTISRTWSENFGTSADEKEGQPNAATLRTALADRRILTLGLATAIFEGSMYLFVFFWAPALKAARAQTNPSVSGLIIADTTSLPFGLIFSSFMCAMMLGSLSFSVLRITSYQEVSTLLLTTIALAAIALLLPVLAKSEACVFWSFALFEVCVGLYYPTMSRLKSEVVEEASRGRVYGVMRIPLNLFVVIALGLIKEGEGYRDTVSAVSGALLLIAFAAVAQYLQ